MTAPAALSLVTAGLSRAGLHPSRARDPAVASRSSLVTILSFIKIGTPCRGLHLIRGLLAIKATA